MKLHANAALSLNKRRQLCRRVVEEDWSLTEAAAAAEVSERTAGKRVGHARRFGSSEAQSIWGSASGTCVSVPR